MENWQSGLDEMRKLTVASKNRGKIAEIKAAFAGLPLSVIQISDFGDFAEPEETGDTFAANAELKARYYSALTNSICLADDSGLEVDALNGAPGVYSARFAGPAATDADNNAKLLNLLAGLASEQRSARFRCVLVYYDSLGELLTAEGTCEGVILETPRGDGGFGYDPLFYVPEIGKTLAEMTLAEKNAISHRGAALRALANALKQKL
jgi:XTP/dITP diphosphohydrolase